MYVERTAPANAANSTPGSRDHAGGEMDPLTQGPRSPRAEIAVTPTLPNSFISEEHREAALRGRGLHLPAKISTNRNVWLMNASAASEAEWFEASWLIMHRTSESSDSECGPPHLPDLQGTRSTSSSVSSPDTDVFRRPGEGKIDLPHPEADLNSVGLFIVDLEFLHEEPPEQAPITLGHERHLAHLAREKRLFTSGHW
jgi:hypothetical protein